MKSKEEFIAGIYQKADGARRTEVGLKDRRKWSAFCNNKSSVVFALAGIALVCGLLFFGKTKIQPESETDSQNLDLAQEANLEQGVDISEEENPGIALAQNEPQGLASDLTIDPDPTDNAATEEFSGPKVRATAYEEASIRAKLLRTELAENGTILYYEALAVTQIMQIEEESEKEERTALPEVGAEFSLILTEEEVAGFYPSGIIPGSIQILLVCREEKGLALSWIEEEEPEE